MLQDQLTAFFTIQHTINFSIALCILFGGLIGIKILNRVFIQSVSHTKLTPELRKISSSLLSLAGSIIIVLTALNQLGVYLTPIVASLSLTSFAVSYACKDALQNIIAGFIILYNKTNKIGDTITAMGQTGKVTEINLRQTHILTKEQNTAIIANNLLLNMVIIEKPEPLSKPKKKAKS